MMDNIYSTGYSPVGDLTVVSICFVMIVLILFSYIKRSRSFRIFLSLLGVLMFAAYSSVAFNMFAQSGKPEYFTAIKVLRCTYHAALFTVFLHFVIYIGEVTRLEKRQRAPYDWISALILIAVVLVDVIDTFWGRSVHFTDDGVAYQSRHVFFIGYILNVILIVVMLARVRKRIYKRVMMGFYGSMAISFIILLMQGLHGQSSYTVATFFYPVLAMLYLMHSNPYDAQLGAIDVRAFQDMVAYNFAKKRDFVFMSLYMRSFDEEGREMPVELQAQIRRFTSDFFRKATLFLVDRGHMVLLFTKRQNPDYEDRIREIMTAFQEEYRRYQYDYKIVIGDSIDAVSRKNEYVSFIRGIHREMPENSVHRVEAGDVTRFDLYEHVLRELDDIYNKRDLDDPRVLTYCQPVYNIAAGRYDTAEALMRLQLRDIGLVRPDLFIPLAEEHGYIHVLTEIILNKTCKAIRALSEAGYAFTRISVNVSALELKDKNFCADFTRIIDDNSVNGDRIAIELTESNSDSDFMIAKDKINELREKGIKFYLDDFGTGYSNMERIMELPFDIIKFDRSMLQACGASERSHKMVLNLARMLDDLNYSVLYEGVEKDADEKLCLDMAASYLQGYKYSRPVPIEKLTEYFEKR